MWVGDSVWRHPEAFPRFLDGLREMGVDTGMVHHQQDPKPWADAGFPFYLENVVNRGLCLKWNSNVRDWDAFVTRWKDSRDEAGCIRDYCLEDPAWRAAINAELRTTVARAAPHAPLMTDLRDELSTTLSANPFDYDMAPASLAAFRTWLRARYPSLDHLNACWLTDFAAWDEARPFLTDQVKHRMATGEARPGGRPDWHALQGLRFDAGLARAEPVRWNLAPWCDFRSFMDDSLAGVLDEFRRTCRAADPATPVGIEGTQMPHAFGGYDLWKLAQVLDWAEPYDIACAREIFGSFMPGKPLLSTVGEQDARAARRRLWHLLLEGDRGCIIWWSEDCFDWSGGAPALTARARALAPVLRDLRSPLAALFLRARREVDPVLIHYSQPSIQVAWLLESTVDGSTWLRRFSSYEAAHNRHAQVRGAWLELLQDCGLTPRFVSQQQIERGGLGDARVLVLPCSWAMSEREVGQVAAWRAAGAAAAPRTILCDGAPGLFDDHGRLRARGPFDAEVPPEEGAAASHALVGPAPAARVSHPADIAAAAVERLGAEPPTAWHEFVARHTARVPRPVRVPPSARVRVHRYRLGAVRLVALERNIVWQMGENLQQQGGNRELERPLDLEVTLDAPAHVHDLRTGRHLGLTASFPVRLDPWEPALFALSPRRLPAEGAVEALLREAGD